MVYCWNGLEQGGGRGGGVETTAAVDNAHAVPLLTSYCLPSPFCSSNKAFTCGPYSHIPIYLKGRNNNFIPIIYVHMMHIRNVKLCVWPTIANLIAA